MQKPPECIVGPSAHLDAGPPWRAAWQNGLGLQVDRREDMQRLSCALRARRYIGNSDPFVPYFLRLV